MNILHIAMGSPEFDAAARDLGYEVQRIAWRDFLGRKFVSGHDARLQRKIIETAQTFRPDLVFVQTHQSDIIAPETYAALRAGGAFVVNWCGDVREPLPECYVTYAAHVDVMAFSNLTDVELIRAKGHRSEYLQIGYDPTIYHPGVVIRNRSGVVFMANHYAGRFPNTDLREQVARKLSKLFDYKFTLYGSGWGIPSVRHTGTAQEEADIYRRSLVAVNVDHFTRPYFASDRILRAQACGCATISWDYEGLKEEHPLVGRATSIEEIVKMVKHALDNPAQAEQVGKASAAATLENHTWRNRIKTMEGWLS